MRGLFSSLLGYFLTPGGLIVLAALDSTLVFFLPLGIDFVLILLAARKPELFWLYALLATVGSMAGAAATYWLGRKVGEVGLARLIQPGRLKKIEERVGRRAAISVAALAVIPPPFPFTAFLLTSGALRVDPWKFFVTLTGVRLLRFMAAAALAARYGGGIVRWMDSETFVVAVGIFAAVAIVGTVVSGVALYRTGRAKDGGGEKPGPPPPDRR
jgi:membrane protein YqaA with SNARE-associated domain